MVVVSINHRLNVLGFTYLAEFGGPDFAQSGDVGMLDIVHALKWVRQNIEHFGGDPNTVTIFGQSGGGRKVGTLLAMPSAKGLFHRAIIESGPTMTLVEQNQATKVASELLAKLGLNKSQVRELQNLPVEQDHVGLLRGDAEHERRSDDHGLLAHRGRESRAQASVCARRHRTSPRACR